MSLAAETQRGDLVHVTVADRTGVARPEYEQRFSGWAKDIEKALKAAPDAKADTITRPSSFNPCGHSHGVRNVSAQGSQADDGRWSSC